MRADAPAVASAPVTFGLRSAASSLANFPKFQQAGDTQLGNGTATIAQKGALLTAVAAMLRYHQNRGELGVPTVRPIRRRSNQFLTAYCPTDAKGKPDLRRLPCRFRFRRAGGQSVARRRIHRRRRCRGGRADSGGHRRLPGAGLAGAAFPRAVPERRAGGRALRGGDRYRRRWLHRDSGSQPAVRAHQPERLSDRLQCCRRRLEGAVARCGALRAAQPRHLPASWWRRFRSPPRCCNRWPPTSRRRPEPAGSPSNSSIRWMRRAIRRRAPAALPSYLACDGAQPRIRFRSERAAVPRTGHRPGAGRVAHRPVGKRCRPPTRPPARNSTSRWRPQDVSASRRLGWSTGPHSPPESHRAVWCRSSALGLSGSG